MGTVPGRKECQQEAWVFPYPEVFQGFLTYLDLSPLLPQHRIAVDLFLADQGFLYKNKDFGMATRAQERIERDRAGTKLQLENDEV